MDVQLPEIVQAGIDTVSFYLPLERSPAIEKVPKLPGKPVAYGGRMLGDRAWWGQLAHTFGYRAVWMGDSKRLYLWPKLAPPDLLCPVGEFEERGAGEDRATGRCRRVLVRQALRNPDGRCRRWALSLSADGAELFVCAPRLPSAERGSDRCGR